MNDLLKKDKYNCIAETDDEALKLLAEGIVKNSGKPLSGMPILVKDNIDVRNLHTTAGSLALVDNIAETDAPVIANLRKNGAVIVGKTNMTEFANFTSYGMPAGYSSRGGQVIHADDPNLSPSGSSSGSAVAVAAGLVPAAIGTDTSFSVIACAQENGICGLKPPAGVLSQEGIIPIARTLDSAGVLARNFSDALKVYSCMRDDPLDPIEACSLSDLRIAVNIANQDMVSEGQTSFLNTVRSLLAENGVRVQETVEEPVKYLVTIMRSEFREQLEAYLSTSNASRKTLEEIVSYYEENPDTMMKYGIAHLKEGLENSTETDEYKEAMKVRAEIKKRVSDEIREFDAVIMTGPTNIMHFCGLPSVCIASDVKNDFGVNRGLILYGAAEADLYRAALAIEKTIKNGKTKGM